MTSRTWITVEFYFFALVLQGCFSPGNKAVSDALIVSISKDDTAAIQAYLSEGGSPNGRCPKGIPILTRAIVTGSVETVRILLAAGANPDIRSSPSGRTPVFFAITSNRLEALRLLLANGSDPDKKDKNGFAPLTIAARRGRVTAVKMLLASGANANVKTPVVGHTPLMEAHMMGHGEVVKVLKCRNK